MYFKPVFKISPVEFKLKNYFPNLNHCCIIPLNHPEI